MKTIFLIFIGGGVGSVFRFWVSTHMQRFLSIQQFPVGTLLVNVLSCILIGYLTAIFKDNPPLKYLFITGFCGGFTTFSTFSMESFQLWQLGNYSMAVAYIALSILLGLLGVFLGFNLVKS